MREGDGTWAGKGTLMGKGTKHARDWKETPLQVIIDAVNLYKHSVKIMGNPKAFDPAKDFNNETLHLIQRELLNLYLSMRTANLINVNKFPDRAKERLDLQRKAMTSCDLLFAYLDLVKSQFSLDSGKFWYWVNLLRKTAIKMAAWHKADVARYGEIAVLPPQPPLFDHLPEVKSRDEVRKVAPAKESEDSGVLLAVSSRFLPPADVSSSETKEVCG